MYRENNQMRRESNQMRRENNQMRRVIFPIRCYSPGDSEIWRFRGDSGEITECRDVEYLRVIDAEGDKSLFWPGHCVDLDLTLCDPRTFEFRPSAFV
jgi:hypothetical protein